jgi:hypothetical protein
VTSDVDRLTADECDYLSGAALWAVSDWRTEREPPSWGDIDHAAEIGDDGGMGKTPIVAVLVVCLSMSGCSWLFVERLPSNYDGTSEPMCSTGKGVIVLDGIFAIVNLATAIAYVNQGEATGEDVTAPVVVSILGTLVHVAAGFSGDAWVDTCREAKSRPRAQAAVRDGDLIGAGTASQGFYCTTSTTDPTIAACNRDVETCEESQRRLVSVGNDVTACGYAPAAMCFAIVIDGKRRLGCAPTVRTCERQREIALSNNPGAEVSGCRNNGVGTATMPTPERVEYCFTIGDGAPNCFSDAEKCNAKRESVGGGMSACEAR